MKRPRFEDVYNAATPPPAAASGGVAYDAALSDVASNHFVELKPQDLLNNIPMAKSAYAAILEIDKPDKS